MAPIEVAQESVKDARIVTFLFELERRSREVRGCRGQEVRLEVGN